MKVTFQQAVLPALISSTLMLGGCGGSSTTDPTTTASKSVSGIITGFGSVFVNGIEFETNNAQFDVDGNSKSRQSDLRVGMRVKLKGTVNADGKTGTAESIVYQNELQGPVTDLVKTYDTVDPALLVSVQLTILGQSVEVNGDTTFDDDFGLTMDGLQVGDVLEISGFSSSSGIIATHIEKQKDGSFSASVDEVEIKGEISGLTDMAFVVRGLDIQYGADTKFDDGLTAGSLTDGLYVEVQGIYDETSNVLTANKIEAVKDRMDESDDEAEIEGVVADFDDTAKTFSIQGQVVDFSAEPMLSPANLQLADGLNLEVEGKIVEGKLVASKIKQRGQKIKVKAMISSINDIDTPDPSISLSLFGGEGNITVRVNTQTRYKDDMGMMSDLTLQDLQVGDYIEIKAFYDGSPVINALKVERNKMGKMRLQAPVSGFDDKAQTVTMFGQDFDLTQAEFSAEDMSLAADEFFTRLADGVFVELTDRDNDGVIDEAKLEEDD